MKRSRKLAALLLAALMLAGCAQTKPGETTPTETPPAATEPTAPPTTEPTTAPTTEPTTAPTTAPTTESTIVPTAPIPLVLAPELWEPREEPLSHEEYFSQDRPFAAGKSEASWFIADEGTGMIFTLTVKNGLLITSDSTPLTWQVPNAQVFTTGAGMKLLGTDGRSAYLWDSTRIISVDLVTGEYSVTVTGEKLESPYLMGGAVLYYIRYEQGLPRICRLYAPEGQEEVLWASETPLHALSLTRPASSQSPVKWQFYNPAMVIKLEEELGKSGSAYQKIGNYDYSELWKTPFTFGQSHYELLIPMIMKLQEDTGIPAMAQEVYDCTTAEVTRKTGKMDNCWAGTSWPHDHYSDKTTSDAPVPVSGEPQVLPVPTVDRAISGPVLGIWKEENRTVFFTDGTSVYRLSLGGTFTVVYTARYGQLRKLFVQELRGSGDGRWVCVLDGSSLVAVDPENSLCKTLVTHDHFQDAREWEEGRVYIAISEGLFYQQYLYDPQTGKFEKISFA